MSSQRSLEIVAYCDSLSTQIGGAARKLNATITSLHKYRQTLISNTVTGKIDVREKGPHMSDYPFVNPQDLFIIPEVSRKDGRKMSRREQALRIVREKGVARPRDLAERGINSKYLTILRREGRIERVGRGLYVLAEADVSEHQSLVEAAKRVPNGVICLLSALQFHDLTTQLPFEVWMALEEKAWQPRVEGLPMRFVRFSGKAWEYGVEEHRIDGVVVRVYGVAKTVADCFKYRHKIGKDVAVEALREAWAERRVTMAELWEAADACRMRNVMRPYMEALA